MLRGAFSHVVLFWHKTSRSPLLMCIFDGVQATPLACLTTHCPVGSSVVWIGKRSPDACNYALLAAWTLQTGRAWCPFTAFACHIPFSQCSSLLPDLLFVGIRCTLCMHVYGQLLTAAAFAAMPVSES